MTLEDIANALVSHCRNGTEREALESLYAADAVSVEARAYGDRPRATEGVDGISGKHDWWDAHFEITGGGPEGPFLHAPDRFSVIFNVVGREKATGETFDMKEIALYTIADGKIVKEEFFNPTME